MGCNGSKKADIVRDRQRVGAGGGGERVASAAAEGARSAAVGIGAVALGGENGAVGQYGKSWTEEHLAEQDFLKAVLERTQSNLIDVSQEHVVLDEKDVEERIQKYSQHFSNTDAARVAFSRLVNAIHGMPPCKFAEEIDEMQLQQILRDSREIGLKTDSFSSTCAMLARALEEDVRIAPVNADLVVTMDKFDE